jgi:hypothetical protein
VKTIKKAWIITDEQLMELPYAPRLTYERAQPVIKPLSWNTKLLEAVVQLARMTKDNFPRACVIAEEAFEQIGRPCGAKQLTDEILLTGLIPQQLGSGNAQVSAGASNRRQSAPISAQL